MYIHIDHNSGVPISAQMIEQIKYLAVSGALRGNQKIPSVRGLASQLKLNPTTVARVYRQLEAEEIIFTQRGKGTFVAPRRSALTDEEKQRRLAGDIRKLVVEAAVEHAREVDAHGGDGEGLAHLVAGDAVPIRNDSIQASHPLLAVLLA